jgi:nitronate monooxygenase
MSFSISDLEHPVVLAPMGGGPSTPELAGAVCESGGLGFLAAGYQSVEAVRGDLEALRGLTGRPFGINLFAPPGAAGDPAAVADYAERLRVEAERRGVPLGEPRHDDDGCQAKLELCEAERVPVVSFTFGCPDRRVLDGLRRAGCATWVTVTTASEAATAAAAGADALVVQGVEAGGHRGSFDPSRPGEIGLLTLLQQVRGAVGLPLVATGGIGDGRGVAAVLAAGAAAAQLGTAFMLAPEAGTSAAHREALRGDRPTALTRAFTGRTARGLENRFMREHGAAAPVAYPEVHHLTAPLRAAARRAGDAEGFHLWAGEAYQLALELPAGELVRRFAAEARAALAAAALR